MYIITILRNEEDIYMCMTKNKSIFDEFVGVSSKQITVKFALNPIDASVSHLNDLWENIKDQERHDAKPVVTSILNDEYEKLINSALWELERNPKIDWESLGLTREELVKAIASKTSKEKNNAGIEKEEDKIHDKYVLGVNGAKDIISKALTSEDMYSILKDSKIFSEKGYLHTLDLSDEEKKAVLLFDNNKESLKSYFANRENYFAGAGKEKVSVASRIVDDNFERYCKNTEALKTGMGEYTDIYASICNDMDDKDTKLIDEISEYSSFNNYLSQKQINIYNYLIGTYNQKMSLLVAALSTTEKEKNILRKKLKLNILYKQIGCKAERRILFRKIENDSEIISMTEQLRALEKENSIIDKLEKICNDKNNYDMDAIYISEKRLSSISNFVVKGSVDLNNMDKEPWELIEFAVRHYRLERLKLVCTKKQFEKEETRKLGKVSLQEMQAALNSYVNETKLEADFKVIKWFDKFSYLVDSIKSFNYGETSIDSYLDSWKKQKVFDKDILKEYLDIWMDLRYFIYSFDMDDSVLGNEDSDFMEIVNNIKPYLGEVNATYNMIRNYVTKSNLTKDMVHICFDKPTLANGWDRDKEREYGTYLLRRNDKYYLAIINVKKPFVKLESSVELKDNCYERLVYKQFPKPYRMIPKCSVSMKAVKQCFSNGGDKYIVNSDAFNGAFEISREEYDLNNDKKFWNKDYLKKTGDIAGYKESTEKWIEFCLKFLKAYKTTSQYDYSSIKKPFEYQSVEEFYSDLDKIMYKLDFEYVDDCVIRNMTEQGNIIMFQIYCQDYAEGKTSSNKNLHTLYWEAIFSEENRKSFDFMLNAGAQIFMRPIRIKNPYIHKAGDILVNKRYIDNSPIPNEDYELIKTYLRTDGRGIEDDKERIKKLIKNVKFATKEYDVVKDRRYTKEHYEIHIPITINNNAADKVYIKDFNERVNQVISNNPDVNIIGLDRGEKNLITCSVINQKGEILEQKSFNICNNMNYQVKLGQREQERNKQRRSWDSIESIKDLKQGYISQVVHEVATLMIKYNAIVVMENLNFGFKKSRTRVEKQVYQKFEIALIKKLEYLVLSKKVESSLMPGGIMRGYQLTYQPALISEVGRQCGFIYYVPAAYTSKIDPTTGFVNVFNMMKVTTKEARKDFFTKFDDIYYDSNLDRFAFEFDYNNFDVYCNMSKTKWTVYSNKCIHTWNAKERKVEPVNITEKMLKLFEFYNIDFTNNLYQQLKDMPNDNSKAEFWGKLDYWFRRMLLIRNCNSDEGIDQIVSPVLNRNNEFFETPLHVTEADNNSKLPIDGDTNGAYHIALKGLYFIQRQLNIGYSNTNEKANLLKISNEDWFNYRQG